jgi:predicted nucleic acid-binding protein
MNHAVVIDASVLFKVLIREEFSDRSQALYANALHASRPVFAPPHWATEVTHGLYRLVRRRGITGEEADQALRQFLQFPVQVITAPELYYRALLFSRAHTVSTYDSLYVVLAQMLDTELWTDDRRLLSSVESIAPWVRWIGDFSLA